MDSRSQEQVVWLKKTETWGEIVLKVIRELPFKKGLDTKKRDAENGVSNSEHKAIWS